MKPLIIYCHPSRNSFTHAVKLIILKELALAGIDYRLTDLYADSFNPVLECQAWQCYAQGQYEQSLDRYVKDIQWCDTLVFIYPTWWHDIPAMLKGWFDRVLLPGIAFSLPSGTRKNVQPKLQKIERVMIFTSCGASWGMSKLVGEPGRKMIFRGLGFLCAKSLSRTFLAHYSMDNSTVESRQCHLRKVAEKIRKQIASSTKI